MKKKTIYIILACVFAALAVAAAVVVIVNNIRENAGKKLEDLRDSIKQYDTSAEADTAALDTKDDLIDTEKDSETDTGSGSDTAVKDPFDTAPDTDSETGESETAPDTSVRLPSTNDQLLDFESLRTINPEICGWLEIDGTLVDYPVLQSATNDEKYLTTAYNGSYYIGGSLFTQATYNSSDFNDPVTVIYGHTMPDGTLFGQLQSVYTNSWTFSSCSDIKLYVPGEVRHYKVFAAVPYSNIHIMYSYDFSQEYWYNLFFKHVLDTRTLGANFDTESTPEFSDRVLILSTCLNEDSTKRFLVMAVLVDDLDS